MNMTMTAPSTLSAPSIASSAMLVELNISTWTARKKDRAASDDVTRLNNAQKGVASVSKHLLGDCAELDAVQKFAGNTRNVHYSATMPWSDSGLRLLPTTQYFKYHQQMTALRDEFTRLVDAFLGAYAWEITQAQAKLGHLFNAEEYPDVDGLRDKFKFRFTYIPLPDAGDFRVDVGNEAQAVLREQYASAFTEQLNAAMNDLWSRTHAVLIRMSERLDYGPAEQKKIFRDSLVENVVEMIDLLRACNITQSVQMAEMADTLERALRGVTPDNLREDARLRADTKKSIDAAIAALPSLM
jgi:hypothetical protein